MAGACASCSGSLFGSTKAMRNDLAKVSGASDFKALAAKLRTEQNVPGAWAACGRCQHCSMHSPDLR